jgi:DNA-binding transcriptional regulator YdaS (Cro superfamily)
MKPSEFFDAIQTKFPEATTDNLLAKLLGLTPGRISQLRKSKRITPKQIASIIKRTRETALSCAIRPIVELYPIERIKSKQNSKWEILPTKKDTYPRNYQIRRVLEDSSGVYFFYNSEGEVLYTGKTEKQTLWKELNLCFNRERESHTAFMVDHPTIGNSFKPAWEKLRQPVKRIIYFHDVASFFSAYEVAPKMIGYLEALIVRAICNDLSNVKMEKF